MQTIKKLKVTKGCRKKSGCEFPGGWEIMIGKTFEEHKKAA